MLILLSPAKTMVGSSRTTVPFVTVPLYKNEAEHIAMEMAGYSVEELSGMLGINRNLALQTKERYNVFHSPDVHGLPALLAYTGIVFRYISPADFTEADFEYAQNHLRMASACYGLTRPLDVIKPYRMEYTVELPSMGIPVSEYWKPLLTDKLIDDTKAAGGILVNLASREIQQSFDWSRINKRVRVITPEFKVYKGDAYHDALFKYGSLIATGNDATVTEEKNFVAPTGATTTNDVVWYPGNFNVTGIGSWDDVPYITDASNIPSGNTPELVAQGKGDPCRLAALSPHQIGAEGKVDNQQWHMANSTEYAILMKAANGAESKNDNGYCSFHELLIPNVKYRNESGVLVSSHNYKGNYWSTESNKAFSFDSQNPTAAVLGAAAPGQGYTVRCVRNNIPAARITINPPTSVNYKGAAINGLPFYVDSNVPYWKMELIKSGDHVGTSMNFDDFSFTPLATGVMHEIEGSYTQTPKAYIARRESRTEDRTFGVKFTSMHFTGEETTYYFTITQNRYSIRGIPSINGLGTDNRIKGEGGKYTIHIELTPDDVAMPTGAQLKVRYTYLSAPRGEESTVATITDGNQHGYDVELNILANDTPDVIGLSFVVYMKEKDESGYRDISSSSYSYYQNTK